MEAKTIGKFIAVLRKANGLTQRELAEKLNVSDKTVSRWERDECAPDLSLIPVLAELFGVTSDELLRGERMAPREGRIPVEPAPGTDKQRKHLLDTRLTRYRNGCWIALGIGGLGLLGAMLCDLGFLRGIIGFFVACVFYVASAVCQGIFLNGAMGSVRGEETAGDVNRYKLATVRLAKTTFGTTLALLGFTLPLILLVDDPYVGLSGDSWLLYGLAGAAGLLLVWAIACHFINGWIINRGICTLEPRAEEVFRHNRLLKRRCALLLLTVFLATGIFQLAAGSLWDPRALAKGREFDNYGDFKAYMETETQYQSSGSAAIAPSDTIYYDMYGNEVSREEALRTELRIWDGTEEGKLVCTYLHLNYDAAIINTADTEDGLPVTVITNGDLAAARGKSLLIHLAFIPLYVGEAAAVWCFYRKKRAVCNL